MATDPKAWIYRLIDLVPGFLSSPARWIADRIFAAFNDGVEFARWLKSGFEYLYAKGKWLSDHLRAIANETVITFRWLIDVRIPQLIGSALNTARTVAQKLIDAAVAALNRTLSVLDKWAKAAIASVTNALNKARDMLYGLINSITARLAKTVDVWYARLTDPTKFAEWLIGALMGPLWRYVYANRDKIARWFLRSSPAFVEWLAKELDLILRRIL